MNAWVGGKGGALGGVIAISVALAAAAPAGASRSSHRPEKPRGKPPKGSCAMVTPAMVRSTLGLSVGRPNVTRNPSVIVCEFSDPANRVSNVVLRIQTAESMQSFASERQSFDQHGEPTSPVSGFGNAAFTSTLGSGQYTQNTIEVLKGTTTLLVTAPASLPRVEALATQLLAEL